MATKLCDGDTKLAVPAFHTVKEDRRRPIYRAHMLVYTLAILALVYHRVASLMAAPTLSSFALFLCLLLAELVLAFMWACTQAFRWRPIRRIEHCDRLPHHNEWPALDVFVCTADPHKEPPAGVVSTALSLMAFDYPTKKLSVYVSDDGGSEVTFFAFMEAARFAKHWLPFCKEKGIRERSPEAFFASDSGSCKEYDELKLIYQTMKEKIEDALREGFVRSDILNPTDDYGQFKKWKEFARNNHPTVIQVLSDSSRDKDIRGDALPNLIYFSREKRPSSPHHFKAGSLNALVRVSRILSNAPVILTMDCDTYSTDPTSPCHALCYFMDPAMASNLAFVQFPQHFHGVNKSDIYGGAVKYLYQINPRGMDGLRGPNYVGTNTFFSRAALQSQSTLHDQSGLSKVNGLTSLEEAMAKALEVASCNFELSTKWGSTAGFRYGSLSEDFHTGIRLHCEGWSSVFCDPPAPAFMGDTPKTLHDVLSQCRRWVVGLYQVTFSRYCPLTFGTRNVSLLMALCYSNNAFWGIWFFPITTYAILPQLALLYDRPLFPKASDPWFYLYAYLFLAAYVQDMADFCLAGGMDKSSNSIGRWWSDQRIWMVRGLTSCLFGTLQYVFQQVGISTQSFNVTSKVMADEQNERYNRGVFDFGNLEAPFFVVLGFAAILSLVAFAIGLARAVILDGAIDVSLVTLLLTGFIVINCWPIYEAMFFRRDGGRMSAKVTAQSMMAVALLVAVAWPVFLVI